ncbi:MAG: septum formation initiator family protein [Firmicutes bacterium]|nr:septum formation initiator family protein [Bacillota bacterium]MDD4263781.1 septum formation initiator family protein [Bacillota bacterium]MDD4693771.1 septum formation initiator family protein [Bacillota bacterium]
MAKKAFKPNFIQLCLLVFLLSSFGWSMYKIISTQRIVSNLRGEIEKINSTISDIRYKQQTVEAEIAKWNDPDVIEEFARKELGLVKPGEITYMFSEAVQPATDSGVTKRTDSSKEGIRN